MTTHRLIPTQGRQAVSRASPLGLEPLLLPLALLCQLPLLLALLGQPPGLGLAQPLLLLLLLPLQLLLMAPLLLFLRQPCRGG